MVVKTKAVAQKAIWLSGISITIILSVTAYAGLVIYAHYQNCDPIKSGLVYKKDQLMPLFVMDLLSDYPGFPGKLFPHNFFKIFRLSIFCLK